MNAVLSDVLKHPAIWCGDSARSDGAACVPSGYAELDAALPGGGWPRAGMSEIVVPRPGSGELALLWPALRRLSVQTVFVIQPPFIPYAPAWATAGIALERLVWVRSRSRAETLWAMEQALREPDCGAVLGWADGIDDRACRRLLLAGKEGGSCGFLLRTGASRAISSPLPLRLGLESGAAGLTVHVLKRRGAPLTEPLLLRSPLHALAGPPSADAGAGRLPEYRHAA
ncbi:CDP-6-deoxy-delta-3,4-glucoseen reductase [Jeongeupia sp. HS-3]|uniref:translesion DNA synthesis-associated protein ImuA n=1 Tax=Jeongeupia sp. HS-3 TaxID=1009682 RepID=UPI0018A5659B|nr:translesion DNA synthesis-associated protein ImuA [Jeongeupia sp. HS-3]BCL76064.1 CDP-6-deoxy-delta-3,4-glucoseen reductase [Jeongeupia sp. HS-3]